VILLQMWVSRHATGCLGANPSAQWGLRLAKDFTSLNLREDHASGGEAALCSTHEENAKVMVDNLAKTFSLTGTFDPTAVASVRLQGSRLLQMENETGARATVEVDGDLTWR
jgi:hypothetical protein